MMRLALKMLYGDRAKYAMLICGLTFCSLLMTQQTSVFCGLMLWTTATLRNIRVPIWVTDAKVEQVNEVVALREIEVDRVRSVPGVEWAVPLYWGILEARLKDGSFQQVQLTGLDTATLVGRPSKMTAGSIEDLRLPNAVIIDQVAVKKFKQKGIKVQIGDSFEINDTEARVVGICESEQSFLGQPYVFTTYDRALAFAPQERKMLSFVLVQPKPGVPPDELVKRIRKIPGLGAFTSDDFFLHTIQWYVRNTGIPISFGTVVVLGVIVGIAIAGQTFYLFIHENLRFMAALKSDGREDGHAGPHGLSPGVCRGFRRLRPRSGNRGDFWVWRLEGWGAPILSALAGPRFYWLRDHLHLLFLGADRLAKNRPGRAGCGL